jgi:hypothetical protein
MIDKAHWGGDIHKNVRPNLAIPSSSAHYFVNALTHGHYPIHKGLSRGRLCHFLDYHYMVIIKL